jgi:cyclopropane fatty-acyl-phospholipid synthase-like methyltransferase
MTEWFEEWFGEEYLQLYPHRDDAEAERALALIVGATGLAAGWRVLDVGCGAGRHARAFRAVGARCVGLDLSRALPPASAISSTTRSTRRRCAK